MNIKSLPAQSTRRRARSAAFLFTSIATLLAPSAGRAVDGVFSSGAFTGDADSGVSAGKAYTAAANVIGNNVVVNGVTFVGSGTNLSGDGWSLADALLTFATGGNRTTTFGDSTIDDLFDGFQYSGHPATLTLNNLEAGQTYTVTLYSQRWTTPAMRVSTITSSEGASIVHDQNELPESVLRYTFVATGTSTDLVVAPKITNTTFHFYGLSNEVVFTNAWTPQAGNSWNTAANWSSGTIPNAAGSNASFSARPAPTTVALDTFTTVGHVEFLGTNSYTIAGAGALFLEGDAGGVSVLKADAGAVHTIATPVHLTNRLAKFGAGTVRLTGGVEGTREGITIGGGTLAIESSAPDLNSIGNVANSGTLAIHNAAPQKLDAIISGTGGLTKSGAGLLTIGGYQEYTGPTVIDAGTLKLSPATALTIANASFQEYTGPLANGSWAYLPEGATWTFTSAGIALNNSPWYGPTNHDGTAAGFIQSNASGTGSISQTIQVAEDGFYNFSFQGVSRGGDNGPNGLLFQVDGTTVKAFDPTVFSQANWQNYAASVHLAAGEYTIAFVGHNLLGGDRATAIDAVAGATGGRLHANTAVSLTSATATLDLSGFNQTIGSLAGVAGSTVLNEGGLTAGGAGTSTVFGGTIAGGGSFTKTGAGGMQLTGANTYAGTTTIAGGTLELLGGTLPGGTALNLSAPGATLLSNGAAVIVSTFAGAAGTNVDLGAGAFTFGDANSTTFAGSLTAGSLTKQGTGRVILGGPLAYSGGATIAEGTLKTDHASTAAAGLMSVAAGAMWDLSTASHTVTGLTGAGLITRSGVLSTGPDGAALISPEKDYALKLDFGNNDGAVVNGVAFDTAGPSGAGYALTGAGTLFIENAALAGYDQLVNDFYYGGNPGQLTFNNLTIGQTYEAVLYTKVGHWANRHQNATFDEDGAGPISNQLLNTDPGTVGYYAYEFVAHANSMAINMAPASPGNTFHWFAASLEQVESSVPTLTIGDSGNYAFTGSINGPTSLIKQGTGTQELGGASAYMGGTTISAGAILSHHAAGVGSGAVSVANGANYLAWWKTGSAVVTNDFILNGPGAFFPGGAKAAIYADGGANGYAEYTLAGTVTLAATSNLGGNNINNLRVLGEITGPGGLTKGGGRADEANTLILGNTGNDYAGETLITKGTVKLANSEVIPHGDGKGGVVVNAGTALDLGGFSETINSLSGAGTVTSTSAVGAPVYFTDDAGTGISTDKIYTHALDFAETTAVTINGVEFAGVGLTGADWSLTGAVLSTGNATTGATGNISRLLERFQYNGNPATLTLTDLTPGVTYETRLYSRRWGGDRTQLFTINNGTSTGTTLFDSDRTASPSYLPLRFTADASGQATITTNQVGAGTFHWYGATNEVVASPVLTVGDATSTNFSGALTGPLGLTKAGEGSLTLTGSSNYTGATSVTEGQLFVNGTLTGTSAVNVTGGTLAGSGAINALAGITVGASGTIAPGTSIGTLSGGSVSFEDDAAFAVEIGATTGDQLLLSGGVFLSGTVSLSLALLADPVDFTVFTVINGTIPLGGYAQGGRFAFGGNVLDEGDQFVVSTGLFQQEFQISYAADGGTDVTLLAVPEPGSIAFLILGATALAGRRRRK